MFVCLIDLILYVPVNNFSVMSGQVFLGLTSTKQGINVSYFVCAKYSYPNKIKSLLAYLLTIDVCEQT